MTEKKGPVRTHRASFRGGRRALRPAHAAAREVGDGEFVSLGVYGDDRFASRFDAALVGQPVACSRKGHGVRTFTLGENGSPGSVVHTDLGAGCKYCA